MRMKTTNNPKSSRWLARVSRVLIVTMLFSVFMSQGWYHPESAQATITYGSAGTLAYSAANGTTVAPAYPGSIVAGDLLVLIIGMKSTALSGGSVTTPTGWTASVSLVGAGGYTAVPAADTGNTNLFTFYKVANGTESDSLTVTIATNNVSWAQIYRFSGDGGWSIAGATGSDATGDASVSIAFGSNPAVTAGDHILGAMCIPTDVTTPAQFSAEVFTQTGATFAAATEISEPDSTTGNDIGGFVARTSVSSGTGSASPTMTATAGGTVTNVRGPGVFIRMREVYVPPVAGTVTVSPDTGTYTSGTPTITTAFTDKEASMTCQYTTNGTTWTTGTVTGTAPNYICTANPTGLTGSVTINMRATTTLGGTGTATAITRTVDNTGPTDGTLTITPGVDQNALSWTAATDGGSGLRTTNIYDVRYLDGTTPPANCSTGTSIYTGTGLSYTHTNLVPTAGGYSYRVCAYDNVNNASAGATRTGLPTWSSTTTSCGRCHAYPPLDGTRSSSTGAVVGDHQPHKYVCSTCHVVPATETSADFAHRNGNIQMKAGATGISGGYYDKNANSVYDAGVDDAFAQTNSPTTATCRNISCHGVNNPTPQWGVGTAVCTDCHNGSLSSPVAQALDAAVTTRRAIVPEFNSTWSHKRSASGAVTKWDCIVCHVEGDMSTGRTNATYHANGYIELRDPDTGTTIKQVTWSGAGAGSYTSGASDATFVRFSRNLSNNTLEAAAQAIQINQCLKCHDADGALSASARVPGGSAEKPFATTIAGAGYTGAGVTANGVAGGVTDVNASFATTNSSYHPVKGKQNNWYAKLTRMVTPWNAATRGGTVDVTSWGPLISCWDCHALPTDTGTITQTVTAHGAAQTMRGNPTVPNGAAAPAAGTNEATLCKICHAGYDTSTSATHGANSAFSSTANNGMTTTMRYGCNMCHSSGYDTPVVRPVRAMDVHGVNVLPTATVTLSSRWSTGTDKRPYAFIRNTTYLGNHQPANIAGTAYSPGCDMAGSSGAAGQCNNQGPDVYTAGGTY